MSLERCLTDVHERGAPDDGASLPAEDVPYYLAWDCILRLEMGGLSGYLYNALPDPAAVRTTIAALERVGLHDLAGLLERASSLFEGYDAEGSGRTWEDVVRLHDPDGMPERLDERVRALDEYGIGS